MRELVSKIYGGCMFAREPAALEATSLRARGAGARATNGRTRRAQSTAPAPTLAIQLN